MTLVNAIPDHVAVAVHSIDAAGMRWVDKLGGVYLSPTWDGGGGFRTRHVRFGNGGKLELLEPADEAGFASAFLDRYGPRIHHVTIKVPDLHAAIRTLEGAGYDVVDVDDTSDHWKEGFLRPSQVGGIIVQVAQAAMDDEGWAELAGVELPAPRPDAPALLGPSLTHADLDAARRVWSALGAHVTGDDQAIVARWPGSPLDVLVEAGVAAGPRGLRFAPDPQLPADDVAGPMTLPA